MELQPKIEKDLDLYGRIKSRCPDAIVQPSTGGAVGMSNEERLQPVDLKPEMATLDCGTCNFGGDDVFVNTENTIKEFGNKMIDLGVKPEIEVFDKGMIDMAIRLQKKGFIKAPMHFNFVYGCKWWYKCYSKRFSIYGRKHSSGKHLHSFRCR